MIYCLFVSSHICALFACRYSYPRWMVRTGYPVEVLLNGYLPAELCCILTTVNQSLARISNIFCIVTSHSNSLGSPWQHDTIHALRNCTVAITNVSQTNKITMNWTQPIRSDVLLVSSVYYIAPGFHDPALMAHIAKLKTCPNPDYSDYPGHRRLTAVWVFNCWAQ